MAKRKEQPQAETPDPIGDPAQERPPQHDPETPWEPGQPEDPDMPQRPEEPEPGPLSRLQDSLEALLDYDQMTEIRIALLSRAGELEKHAKKGSDLGVREEDARRRLRIIQGSDLRFGLARIFAERPVTEQRDVFFDREKPHGRPDADEPSEAELEALARESGALIDQTAGAPA